MVLVALLGTLQTRADLQAETHRFVPTAFHAAPATSHPPAARIRSGDRVVTSTSAPDGAPFTGPFLVQDAEPGDLLVVTFETIEPAAATGYSAVALAPNALEPGALQGGPRPAPLAWAIDSAKGVVRLDLATIVSPTVLRERFASPTLELPMRPMLGSVALASPARSGPDAAALGPSGGYLAYTGVTAGTRVMLRVDAPGALLYLGHGQARRGDGGLTGTGIATPMRVEFGVELVKKREWPHSSVARPSTVVGEFEQAWPRLETADAVSTVAAAPTLQQALQRATLELHHWLDDDFGLSEQSVTLLLGQVLEIEVADAGGQTATVVTRVRKAYLPKAAPAPAPAAGPAGTR
ncbi:MAG: hypothetical protein ABL982_11165 [Vicinamibacterales bacterium]